MKVLVTGPDIAESAGAGVQRHVRTLVECFVGEPAVTIVPFAATSTRDVEPLALKVGRLAVKAAAFPFAAARTDLVHINASINDRSLLRDSLFMLLARAIRRPVLLQFHGGTLATARVMRTPVVRALVRSAVRSARLVTFLSPVQGEPMREALGLARVEYVRNYIAIPAGPVSERAGRTGLRVLYFGRLDAPKGVLETIEGFAAARAEGWELHVAGAGPVADEVSVRAEAAEGVTYLGFLDDEARDRELAWADVFVLPSESEGLPYAALEAAAAGVVLVTSGVGALPTITRDGVTGLIVPPRDATALADALRCLAADRAALARMGAEAARVAREEFSTEMMADAFGRLYEEVAG